MHPNAALIARFYESFAARDGDAMGKCYHDDIIFEDPAFGELRGDRARAMWRMLTGRAKDLVIETQDVTADDKTGSARWIATYTFGKTGRKVRNVIEARFEFRDGLIARHTDSFPMWKWTRMALGPMGALLGWTPMVQARVRREAVAGLERFLAP